MHKCMQYDFVSLQALYLRAPPSSLCCTSLIDFLVINTSISAFVCFVAEQEFQKMPQYLQAARLAMSVNIFTHVEGGHTSKRVVVRNFRTSYNNRL